MKLHRIPEPVFLADYRYLDKSLERANVLDTIIIDMMKGAKDYFEALVRIVKVKHGGRAIEQTGSTEL